MENKLNIDVNGVDIEWDLQRGGLDFLGISSTIFWNDPSLLNMFKPLVKEIGKDMFCLQVAHSSSLGTGADYDAIMNKLGDRFEEGFLNWGNAVGAAGWGTFEIEYIDFEKSIAKVIVYNPWELEMQKSLDNSELWGCPFMQGKLIGIFNHAFDDICWASEKFYFTQETSRVEFDIHLYKSTIEEEIEKLRKRKEKEKILHLETIIKEKTKEQSLLLSLFDKGDTVLFKWNSDAIWSIADVSLSVNTLVGYSKNDFISNKISYASYIHKDDIKKVTQEVNQAIKENLNFFKHQPYRIITKNNEIKWVLDYTTIVRDDDDNITHFIGAISDITELRNKDKQLLQQSRMAQMGEMISMIAHQWRQPLAAISANTIDLQIKLELKTFDLNSKDDHDEHIKYLNKNLENINNLVQNLTTTIDDFRNFYKPNKKSTPTQLKEVILKSLNIIKASLLSNNIKIIENYNCKDNVEIYQSEMMQVILNILKNSQDNFLEKQIQDPCIEITTHNNKLSIQDNGGGIPKNIIDKIFDPYFSTKEKNGTGLGLYMSKTIVEDHHKGALKVENKNNGTCFTIELDNLVDKIHF